MLIKNTRRAHINLEVLHKSEDKIRTSKSERNLAGENRSSSCSLDENAMEPNKIIKQAVEAITPAEDQPKMEWLTK
jgi:hypothetical protein